MAETKTEISRTASYREVENKNITLHLLTELLGDLGEHVGARLPDGTLWPDRSPRRTTIVLKHQGSLRSMFLPPTEMKVAESYIYDDYDVEGRIEDIFGVVRDPKDEPSTIKKASIALQLSALPRRSEAHTWAGAQMKGATHSKDRDRDAIAYHYNVGNEFFRLFLDERMVYSCAYFKDEQTSLEQAQIDKLDYICRKLQLKPGQKLLDIGCGWGGLIIHAAKHYGVDATGVTLSESQHEWAQKAIEEAGLSDSCRALLCDYRDMKNIAGEESFDAISSVEMFEHVGTRNLPEYFSEAFALLKPRGPMFIQGSCRGPLPASKGPSFVHKYVFPDGELIPIPVVLDAAEGANFEVRDVENLREHFALTLKHWIRNLEDSREDALKLVNEPTYRVWRLYMAVSMYGFLSRRVNLYQAVLNKADVHGEVETPWTRAELY
ncbi:MAG TPA: cyclopropane-fatty-acyl-phospholipid synthase family protein [Abditibacteriaceae bacterium]